MAAYAHLVPVLRAQRLLGRLASEEGLLMLRCPACFERSQINLASWTDPCAFSRNEKLSFVAVAAQPLCAWVLSSGTRYWHGALCELRPRSACATRVQGRVAAKGWRDHRYHHFLPGLQENSARRAKRTAPLPSAGTAVLARASTHLHDAGAKDRGERANRDAHAFRRQGRSGATGGHFGLGDTGNA